MLVLKDASIHYCLLRICDNPSAERAASCMLEWNSLFAMPKIWVSGSETHFKNKVITELARLTGSSCEYILAYCHSKNVSAERVNRDLLQVLRAIVAEMKLEMKNGLKSSWVL